MEYLPEIPLEIFLDIYFELSFEKPQFRKFPTPQPPYQPKAGLIGMKTQGGDRSKKSNLNDDLISKDRYTLLIC